ncbi:ATPase family, AAA domain containing 5 [Nesidiocoris tenuis]|uniref:ATPase family, AAA domain containing 5 n=1 Tax=Nesidiocoris tenuis TaxID=355587 RepID=A0ABN7BHW3_9HEMI|nr:ATPase family, AAA domain containing 5 [Nesidiocoris tenuis]
MKDMTDFFGKKNETKAPAETQSPAEGSKKRARKKTKFFDEIGDEPSPAPKRKSEKKKLAKESSEIAPKENPKVKSKSKRKATEPATVELPMSPEVELVLTVSDESVDAQEVNVSVRKKRKLSAQEKKSPAENGTDYSPTSANNSLLNYFSKMSKSDTPTCKADPKPNLVKVKALVHEPPPTDSNVERKRSPVVEEIRKKWRISLNGKLKKRKSAKTDDFDVIETLESVPLVEDVVVASLPMENGAKSNGEVIELVEDTVTVTPLNSKPRKSKAKVKHDGTLASFFTIGNRVPRPIIELSEDQKRARQNFLQSSTPANIKKIVASSGNTQPLGNPAPHPVVSHVCQRDPMHIMWNLAPVDLKLAETKELTPVKVPSWSSVTSIGSTAEPTSRSISRRASFDQKKALKDLKKEVGALPVAAWFKDLKELKKSNEGLIWSEKFKPKSVVHLTLADVQNVDKLLYWLTRLKDNSKKEECEEDSESDFIVYDEDSSDRTSRYRRAALISGPSGIGKTSIVYAVAKELGYEVLELNASANRSGKRILHDFSEALQSHKVEASQIIDFATKKGKHKNKAVPTLPNMSLILIEDADLLFADNDEGFLSTAAVLAASSKRPVVFVANEKCCKHLLAKVSPYLEIDLHFASLRLDRLNSWLRTVCIVENTSVGADEIDRLIEWADSRDVRKCLLQLEFSKAGRETIPKIASFDCKSPSRVWRKLGVLDFRESSSLGNFLELISMTDVLLSSHKSHNDGAICRRHWETGHRDSTELESPADDVQCNFLTGEIVDYAVELIDGSIGDSSICHKDGKKPEALLADMEKALISPSCLLRRTAVALDFAPTIREIARSEQTRFAAQTKRNNRYFHYLRPEESKMALKMDYDLLCLPFSPCHLPPSESPT